MRIMTRCAIAAVTAGAALVIAAAPANAATGQLVLQDSSGSTTVVRNPPAGCISNTIEFTRITNNTNVYVTVYTDTHCRGFGLVVGPDTTMPVGERHSVLVPS